MSASDAKRGSEPPLGPESSDSGALQAPGARPIDLAPGGDEAAHGTPSGPAADAPTLKELVSNLTVGTVIDGKYAIEAIIGRGGMGVVVSARHVDLGRDVALKFLCSGEGATAPTDMRARFRREAQISARLNNEHITRVLDVGTWKSASYIVMERLEGLDLRRKLKQGPLPVPVALNYTLQICEGIAEAHAHGIVHRDLKPANLFVTRKADGTDLLKIMDFGISKWNGGEIGEITKDGTLLGSPKYMAPEQVFGTRTIDARADIWSIGAILFEMLVGRTPYVETTLARLCAALVAGPPPRLDEINPAIPARLATVVARTLESSPGARTQSVAVLAGALLDAVDAPGEALRERLAVILAMRPVEPAAPSTTSLLSNLALGPVSGATPPSQVISEALPALKPGAATAPAEPSGPPRAETLPSPGSRPRATGGGAAPPARSHTLPIVVAVVAAGALAAFIALRTSASANGKATPTSTAAQTEATAPPPVAPTQIPVVAPVATEPAPTAATTGAEPAPTASAPATATAPTLGPLKGTKPSKPPASKEKKRDDDIPTMR